jgi:hypothetical protein
MLKTKNIKVKKVNETTVKVAHLQQVDVLCSTSFYDFLLFYKSAMLELLKKSHINFVNDDSGIAEKNFSPLVIWYRHALFQSANAHYAITLKSEFIIYMKNVMSCQTFS